MTSGSRSPPANELKATTRRSVGCLSLSLIARLNSREGAEPPGFGTLTRRFTARISRASSRSNTSKSWGKIRASSYIAPVPSSGLRGLAKSGMKTRSCSTDASDSGGSSIPARSAASAARPHSPPSPLVIPTRQP